MFYVLPAILLAIPLWNGIAFGFGLSTTRDLTIPPAPPGISILELPGCLTSNTTDNPITHECLVAKTAYALPDFCSLYPATRNCVILLAPAFCFDGDVFSKGSIQECLALIPQGPCKANPTGRACSSGLFAGFELIKDPTPPNRRSGANNNQQWPGIFSPSAGSPDVLYGGASDPVWDPRLLSSNGWGSTIWCVGQFFEGVAKDLVNSGIEMAELATLPCRLVMKADCWMAKETAYLISNEYGDNMDATCEIFTDTLSTAASYLDRYELDISNKYQSWGARTSEMVQLLMGGIDVIEAFGMGVKLAKLFLVVSDSKGSYLKAATDIGEVIILQLRGEGEAATMEEAEARMLREDLEKIGFDDLVPCGGLKHLMTGGSHFVCIPSVPDDEELIAVVDAFLEDLPAVERDTEFISNPIRASPGRAAEVARSGQPAIDEAALRTEAEGMTSGETRLPVREDVIDPKGKRPAEFPPPGNEFESPRTKRSRVVSDKGQGSGSAAEVPRSPAWPESQFDLSILDDAALPPRPRDPIHPPSDPLELYPAIASDAKFELDFKQVQVISYPGSTFESVMNDFRTEFELGIPHSPGNVRPPSYWRQLAKDGTDRAVIREKFIEEYELEKASRTYTNDFVARTNNLVIKRMASNLQDFQRLPSYKGPGHSRLKSYSAQYNKQGAFATLRDYFNSSKKKAAALQFQFRELLDGEYGSILYPGFMSDDEENVTDLFIFMETKARIFGPMVERYAVDACIQATSEAGDLVYEIVGRVRMEQGIVQFPKGRGWAYIFQLIQG